MDAAFDLYLAVPLLFTVLALVLASVFVRLRRGEGERAAERSREPAAAEPAGEGGPGAAAGPEDEGGRVPVEEVGAGEEGKEAAAEQREEAAEPGPAAEPNPAATESIPRPPPAEPREDAGSTIPPSDASPESSLGHVGQAEDECGHEALPNKAEEEDLDSENEKLVVREPEDEDAADERFSFKYSPGKLRGNQYKSMMTKEELEEEQRIELTSDLTSL